MKRRVGIYAAARNSPLRTRAGENLHLLKKFLRDHPRLNKELFRAGLRVTCGRFRLVAPQWTDDQRRISSLLTQPILWTAQDIARALGKDQINARVLGQIGKDCAAIHAFERSVPRLWNGQRMHVYSFDPLDGIPLPQIRAQYAAERRARG